MTNLLAAIALLERYIAAASKIQALIRKMAEEGRTELTDAEVADLRASDDHAAQALIEAIERAQAEGR